MVLIIRPAAFSFLYRPKNITKDYAVTFRQFKAFMFLKIKQFAAITIISLLTITYGCSAKPEPVKKKRDPGPPGIMLLGPIEIPDLYREYPYWRRSHEAYIPEEKQIALMRSASKPVRLDIYFNAWDEECSRRVPKLIKTLELAGLNSYFCALYGLDFNMKGLGEIDPPYPVESVPTIVIKVNGKKIGEITKEPQEPIEEALSEFLYEAGVLYDSLFKN